MLLSIRHISEDTILGLWRIEPQPSLSSRQNERLAVQQLLAQMLETDDAVIEHLPNGKPTLDGWHISVSHTRGYAAVILSRWQDVGIDIEYTSDRVARIATRFLRNDEQPQGIAELLAVWSAKETLYKLFSEDQLTFQEMRITPTNEPGRLKGENLKRDISVSVAVETTKAYTLTFATRSATFDAPAH